MAEYMSEIQRARLDALERLHEEHREEVRALRWSMRDLTGQVTALAERVEALTSLLQRVVPR